MEKPRSAVLEREIRINTWRLIVCAALASSLVACGGESGSSSAPAPSGPAAPGALSYPAPSPFVRDTAIAQLSPTVTGTPTLYSVSPALPAGLTLNAATGVISGTPAAIQAATTHTVTASNSGGSTTASISITVNDLLPSVSYARSAYTFVTHRPLTPVVPGVSTSGGAVVSWSIDKQLPAGLSFDTTTGRIDGTPASISTPARYLVTATNSGGNDSFDLDLGVIDGVLIDLGHVVEIDSIQYAANRILSVDVERRAVLWNAQTDARVSAFDAGCDQALCGEAAAMAGGILVVRGSGGFDVHSATNGALLAHVDDAATAASNWGLATDGSYFVASSATRIAAWSAGGTLLFAHAGDYSNAHVFATPTEVRVAGGPALANAIELLSVPAGTSTVTPVYSGAFHVWFNDGSHFVTKAGTTATVYSHETVQQDSLTLPASSELGGHGNRFWSHPPVAAAGVASFIGDLKIYDVGSSAAPVATAPIYAEHRVVSSGAIVAVISTRGMVAPSASDVAPGVDIFDSASPTPLIGRYEVPFRYLRTFAAASATEWTLGTGHGLLLRDAVSGSPRTLSLGMVTSIAASAQRVSVATASGRILNFDAAARVLENEIAYSAGKVLLSSDGSVLGAMSDYLGLQAPTEVGLKLFSLPSRAVTYDRPDGAPLGRLFDSDFGMSDSGTRLLLSYLYRSCGNTTCDIRHPRYYFLDTNGSEIWSYGWIAAGPSIDDTPSRLAPSGERFVVTSPLSTSPDGFIFQNDVGTGSFSGRPVGWLDDSRLLINRYNENDPRRPVFSGSEIVNPQGHLVAATPLGELDRLQIAGTDAIYLPTTNLIVNVISGNTLWSTAVPTRGEGAVNDDFVFFASGAVVRVEPRY